MRVTALILHSQRTCTHHNGEKNLMPESAEEARHLYIDLVDDIETLR